MAKKKATPKTGPFDNRAQKDFVDGLTKYLATACPTVSDTFAASATATMAAKIAADAGMHPVTSGLCFAASVAAWNDGRKVTRRKPAAKKKGARK